MSKIHQQSKNATNDEEEEEEEVEIEIRSAAPTHSPGSNSDGQLCIGLPSCPAGLAADASPSKKATTSPGSFFRFAPRSTAIDAEDDMDGHTTMRSRVTNILRLPNSAIKETWSRLDLDLPDELKENLKEIMAIDIEHDDVGDCREGKYYQFVHETLFGSSTRKGQIMGVVLLLTIATSVFLAVIDSVHNIRQEYGEIIYGFEVFFTIVFSIEYVLRVWCLRRPRDYICSAMGIVDLSSIVPTFISLFFPPARPLADLATLRIFRVIRVFRVLRLVRFVDAARALQDNIGANKLRVAVFMFFVFSMIIVIGCAMYLIEGEANGFTNIPVSLYWAVVTLTTVGYGDIAPQTVPGRMLAAVVMFSGYGVIACPLVLNTQTEEEALRLKCECPRCYRRLHQDDANFCRHCGAALRVPEKKQRRLRKKKFQSPDEIGAEPTMEMATTATMTALHMEAEIAPMSLEPPHAATRRQIPATAETSM